jgi:predicted negative regulator of RcsB-dependent stress response
MANQLDLEEQEQLDQLKHFWAHYGNPISWLLIAVLGCVAGWNGYQYWQRNQAMQAAAMFDEVDRVVLSGDVAKAQRAFSEMKDRFPSTTYAERAGLLVAKLAFDAGQIDAAKTTLTWVAEKASDKGYASVAKLRLASVLMDAKAFDEALGVLSDGVSDEFAGLVADRKGDIYALQGNAANAKEQYLRALKALDDRVEYRRLVEVKLAALGVSTASEFVSTSAASVAEGAK